MKTNYLDKEGKLTLDFIKEYIDKFFINYFKYKYNYLTKTLKITRCKKSNNDVLITYDDFKYYSNFMNEQDKLEFIENFNISNYSYDDKLIIDFINGNDIKICGSFYDDVAISLLLAMLYKYKNKSIIILDEVILDVKNHTSKIKKC